MSLDKNGVQVLWSWTVVLGSAPFLVSESVQVMASNLVHFEECCQSQIGFFFHSLVVALFRLEKINLFFRIEIRQFLRFEIVDCGIFV
jgi:hypothetical protein